MWRGPIVGTTDRMGCDVLCGKLLFKGFSAVGAGNGNEWEEWSVMAVKSSGQHRMWAAADKFFERLIHDFFTVELARPMPWLKNKKSFCTGSQTAAHFDIIIMQRQSQFKAVENPIGWCKSSIFHIVRTLSLSQYWWMLILCLSSSGLKNYSFTQSGITEAQRHNCYLYHAYMMQM